MSDAVRQITPEPLVAEAWSPFGWLPVADTDPRDGAELLDYAWHDAHVNLIGHRRDEVPEAPGGLRCQELFRHVTHTQVVMPLDVTAVVVVAPAALDSITPADIDQVRAFLDTPALLGRAAPGDVALGPVSGRSGLGAALQRAGVALPRGQRPRSTSRPWGHRSTS